MLNAVFNWGMNFRDDFGQLLFEQNPMKGLPIPQEKNPNQFVATTDRVEAIRRVSRQVEYRVEWNGRREYIESFLPEILDIVVETARRGTPVCRLHTRDLELKPTDSAPFGAVCWPDQTDKMGKRWSAPLSPRAREAVDSALKKRCAIGPGWLFPSARDKSKPVRLEQAEEWLRKAEELAGLEHVKGAGFHAYRRYWASLRKGLSDVDVARAGGWASLAALKSAYQKPDAERMLAVVLHQAELREVR